MITIQSAMLVALGLLSAGFIGLLLLPLYRRRTERLQLEAIKRSLPMTEAEIRADKDRLRAEYAIRIHQLETRVEETRHHGARQKIELNRRDGRINSLEAEIAGMRTQLEAYENARRVLEQTITDRLPKLEHRLVEATRLLSDRDAEIERLNLTADETAMALEEARQINAQQREELLRANAALTTRAARARDTGTDAAFDAEVALRAELESLRNRSREQAQMLASLQSQLTRAEAAASSGDAAASLTRGAEERYEREIAKLQKSLLDSEEALRAARSSADADAIGQRSLERERAQLKGRIEELETEIGRLKAALDTYQAADKSEAAIRESKVAMKARLSALESAAQSQTVTIQSLRAELAAANDRMARQAAQFRDELKRLGSGTKPVSPEARVVKQPVRRPSLADRMAAPRSVDVNEAPQPDPARRPGFLKALSGGAPGEEPRAAAAAAAPSPSAAAPQAPAAAKVAAVTATGQPPANVEKPNEAAPAVRRSSLLDRISDASKS